MHFRTELKGIHNFKEKSSYFHEKGICAKIIFKHNFRTFPTEELV